MRRPIGTFADGLDLTPMTEAGHGPAARRLTALRRGVKLARVAVAIRAGDVPHGGRSQPVQVDGI